MNLGKIIYYASGLWIFKIIFWVVYIFILSIPIALIRLIKKA